MKEIFHNLNVKKWWILYQASPEHLNQEKLIMIFFIWKSKLKKFLNQVNLISSITRTLESKKIIYYFLHLKIEIKKILGPSKSSHHLFEKSPPLQKSGRCLFHFHSDLRLAGTRTVLTRVCEYPDSLHNLSSRRFTSCKGCF